MKYVMSLLSLLLIATAARAAGGGGARLRVVMDWSTMYAVDEAFVGETNPIRGVIGDELPWTIAGGVHGRLSTNGHLKIRVRGLVFTNDPEVPPELRGKNDETEFRALVSCISEDGMGGVTTVNTTSQGFPASSSGNADIDAQLELPETCVAPVVFILAGSEEKWFAVTGFES